MELNMKLLPIAEPMIRYSPSIDHFLSILNLYNDKTLPWIIENYIEVVFNPLHGISYFSAEFLDIYKFWWNCPFITVSRVERILVNDVVSTIKKAVDNGIYVMVVVDTYYIHEYATYRRDHVPHEIFIHGYGDDFFYTSDYFNFSFCREGVTPFVEFRDAYYRLAKTEKDYLKGLVFFNPNEEVIKNGKPDINGQPDYEFQMSVNGKIYIPDKKLIKQKIEGFLSSSPLALVSYPNEFDPCYGFKTGFFALIDMVNEISADTLPLLKKPLCLIFDHIRLMSIRIQYLEEFYNLPIHLLYCQCSEIEKRCLILRNKYLKDMISNRVDVSNIKRSIHDLLWDYRLLMEKLVLEL